MRAQHLSGKPESQAQTTEQNRPDLTAGADLGASIAEHASRLAHMYFQRARMFSAAGSNGFAVHDKARAEILYEWAMQASETTNVAGHDVLKPQIEQLRSELDSFQLSKCASNTR